ncbi:MAG: hypothetical protein GXO91_04100 [FCB group bacterium]|nr:hypothetical protein [FCB group bacterium]
MKFNHSATHHFRFVFGVIIFWILLSSLSFAGEKTLADWAKNEKKLYKKILTLSHEINSVKQLQQNGTRPVRVGLISVYLYDTSDFKFNAMAHTYGGVYQTSFGLSEKGANIFTTEMAEIAVPQLKTAFKDHGMELLTPEEFLQTDQQKKSYSEYQLEMSGLAKATLSIADWLKKNPTASGAATGYRSIMTHLFTDATALTSLENLRQSLGLDALAVLSHTSSSNKKGVWLSGVDVFMYGPNPVPKPPQKIAAKFWSPGTMYAHGHFAKGFKSSQIVRWKKGKNAKSDYTGYDVIVNTLADKALDAFDEMYAKKK